MVLSGLTEQMYGTERVDRRNVCYLAGLPNKCMVLSGLTEQMYGTQRVDRTNVCTERVDRTNV